MRKKILILYEEKHPFLGDSCINFDKLGYLRWFIPDGDIDFNFLPDRFSFYQALLTHNPHVDRAFAMGWAEIDFGSYDLVLCVTYREEELEAFLRDCYGPSGGRRPEVLSLSLILAAGEAAKPVFPVYAAFIRYVQEIATDRPRMLYLSWEEREWGGHWLEERGVKREDEVFVLIDSTSSKDKLINIFVYFNLLTALLKREHARVLIFDEKQVGKEEFYREWLGSAGNGKLVFSKGQTLREDLCLLAAAQTRLIFGPCSGLIHCASSLYNHYVAGGLERADVPLIIAYTGQYPPNDRNAHYWWHNSPLVDCLLLKMRNNRKELVTLDSLSYEERNLSDELSCSEYTEELLAGFLRERLGKSQQTLQQ